MLRGCRLVTALHHLTRRLLRPVRVLRGSRLVTALPAAVHVEAIEGSEGAQWAPYHHAIHARANTQLQLLQPDQRAENARVMCLLLVSLLIIRV
jgi:hypothetical protein